MSKLFNIYHPKKFVENYINYNLNYTKEDLLRKIESKKDFFERDDDEGLTSLVEDPKQYEWYRGQLYDMIYTVFLDDIY